MENNLWLHKGKRLQSSGPDGLEAWGVAFAASIINFIMAGINRASGILYVEFIDAFQVDRMQASLPFTIRSVSRNLLGPVVGIFGQKYGVRPVILVGGVLGSLSTIACFFVADIFWISVFWGCFNGIGTAMIVTLTQAAIGQHFVKHISTASGIGLSGGCFGSFLFPVLFESLIDKYSIQGTFLFISGIIMHVIPAAIIMRKPSWLKKGKKGNKNLVNGNVTSFQTIADSESTIVIRSKNEDSESLLQENCVTTSQTLCHNGDNQCVNVIDLSEDVHKKMDIDYLWMKRDLLVCLLTGGNAAQFPPPETWQAENIQTDCQLKEIIDLFYRISEDTYSQYSDAKISSSIPKFNSINESFDAEDERVLFSNGHLQLTESMEFHSNPVDCLREILEKFFERDKGNANLAISRGNSEDLSKIVVALKHIYAILESNKSNVYKINTLKKSQRLTNNISSLQSNEDPSNTFSSHIKTAMWLHAKPLYLLTCLCRCVHFITFQPILTTVVDFSRDKGLRTEYGKYAIGALAIGDLVGRLFLGWLTDKKYLSLPRYMFIFMVLQGIFTMAIALTNTAESLLPVLTVYGLLQGSTFIQHPVLVSHYMGKDEQSIAIGCLNFFPGIIGFALPFYIGYFRDTIGSYNGMFYINGSIGCFIGLLWLAEPYLQRCTLSFPQRSQQILV